MVIKVDATNVPIKKWCIAELTSQNTKPLLTLHGKQRVAQRRKQRSEARKHRYHIEVNWYGQVHSLWNHAANEKQALCLALKTLASVVGYTYKYVYNHVVCENRCACSIHSVT